MPGRTAELYAHQEREPALVSSFLSPYAVSAFVWKLLTHTSWETGKESLPGPRDGFDPTLRKLDRYEALIGKVCAALAAGIGCLGQNAARFRASRPCGARQTSLGQRNIPSKFSRPPSATDDHEPFIDVTIEGYPIRRPARQFRSARLSASRTRAISIWYRNLRSTESANATLHPSTIQHTIHETAKTRIRNNNGTSCRLH